MILQPGNTWETYEILALLGTGGMGEVYRAKDTNLDREIALKVMSPSLALTPEGLERFKLEARAVAQLSHPCVPEIYDFGVVHGTAFVAMELLEGVTLRALIDQGPLPPRKVREIGAQVARGLAAAHDKGIVHRDLKPENVFITEDGRIKLLDFGLAKQFLTVPSEGSSNQTAAHASSGSRELTLAGQVLGTVAYMSPEQVRSGPVDHRSDLFSLGILLFEMATGRRPFAGPSMAETMSAILRDDLAGSSFYPALAPELEPVVRRCLEKLPGERYQNARDLAFQLEQLGPGPTATEWQRRKAWKWPLVAGAAVLGLFGLLWAGSRIKSRAVPVLHRLTFRAGVVGAARFVPSSGDIVYSAGWNGDPPKVFTVRPDSPESRDLNLPEGDLLALSSTGEMALSLGSSETQSWIHLGTLARASLGGGAPRELQRAVIAADWSPGGHSLAVVSLVNGKVRLEFPEGHLVFESPAWISHPRISPDGRWVAFLEHPISGDDRGYPAVVDREGHKKVLTSAWASAQGLAWKGDEIWFTAAETGVARALRAVDLKGRLRTVARFPTPLTLHDISPDGKRILMAREFMRTGIRCRAPGSTIERELSWLDWSLLQDLSADGSRVLFNEQGEGSGSAYTIYLRPTDGAPAVKLGTGAYPVLSPDGTQVAALTQDIPVKLQLIPTAAGPTTFYPVDPLQTIHRIRWFPGGEKLLLEANEAGGPRRLYTWAPGKGTPQALGSESFRLFGHPISPDGRRVVGRLVDSVNQVVPLDGSRPTEVQGTRNLERVLRWTADGRGFYVLDFNTTPFRLFALDSVTGQRTLLRTIEPEDPAGLSISNFLLTPDGRAYAYAYRRILSELYLVEGLD